MQLQVGDLGKSVCLKTAKTKISLKHIYKFMSCITPYGLKNQRIDAVWENIELFLRSIQ